MEGMSTKGQIIKGKPVADKISEELIKEVELLVKEGINPKLTIVRVGARSDDLSYERGALKRCQNIGITTEVLELAEDITQEEYIDVLKRVNDDKNVNGILCFRPLPKHLNEEVIKYVIAPEKDVDCFSPINSAKVMEGDKSGFPPCTPTAVVEILKHYNVDLKGSKVTVLGRSMVVGKPVSMLLLSEHATVTICHSKTKNLSGVAADADVLIAAIGRAKMVDETFVKDGAVVIDVGINVDEEGNLCGDVDTNAVLDKVSMITPVPAGVGSVTTSILAKHVVKACKLQNNK
ncbi:MULTISPECIES: bifunctional 5,10-methylenetetrahydrofolate dehydrogenase/5,10-methenyltetrahydrofolate cyclohydrolase [unclassified Clostridioides]|uniref:bifunctional 5,10-methylenetetrahydrofolate dehydrogenase/5,10-methenyltetrahydrofolate cyclohydrolase n=1 Tax=unclassified Clostridioides TaxID=2635829 RepID=UPI0006BC03A6|nr:methenyltetrahydrofolate cyclohydrolase [Clostridioides difficile]MCC0692068.1 bifunctional 5,10-methylene-tetrahydrofolate dehydrogenase/5,10-methylene-tetrahydrofolate cyclohydrolase [Clostridioides sp. ZZV14-6387]MCI9977060.1 bifunctional 5,10-methylene-tetrahydrofolate dehydrogenase/5,10-methylene-tetrahydrofolate cyclohydrolase [Clostridioides difficile]MDI0267379.1 tetrahydrofolate dehydrogenase/cyclohydrolase catalytic domain-containing protein [Clostridioides difficile]MDI7816228.1 t